MAKVSGNVNVKTRRTKTTTSSRRRKSRTSTRSRNNRKLKNLKTSWRRNPETNSPRSRSPRARKRFVECLDSWSKLNQSWSISNIWLESNSILCQYLRRISSASECSVRRFKLEHSRSDQRWVVCKYLKNYISASMALSTLGQLLIFKRIENCFIEKISWFYFKMIVFLQIGCSKNRI